MNYKNIALAGLAAAVWTTDASPSQAQSASAATPAQAGATSVGIPEVVVTAERRDQSLQSTSLAIQAFSGDALTEAGISQTRDLVSLSPGVEIGQGGPATQVYIRGVGDFTSTPVTNPAVSFYSDGIYIARAQSIEGNFFDLDRIEVLKGPQGTLYGRNASGGAINLITNRPKLDGYSGNASIETGDYGEVKGEAALNVPLGSTAALRGAFQVVRRDGYDTGGQDDDQHQSFRLQGLWEPSDTLSLRTSVDFSHIGGNGPAYVFKGVDPSLAGGLAGLGIPLPTDPRATGTSAQVGQIYYGIAQILGRCVSSAALTTAKTATGAAPITGVPQGLCAAGQSSLISPDGNALFGQTAGVDNKFLNISAELNYNLGFATLTVLPGYRKVDDKYVAYPVLTFGDDFGRPESSQSFSVETRLAHDSDRFKWVAGTYVFNEHQSADTGANAGLITGRIINDYVLDTQSYAGFAQATYSIVQPLRVIAGIRYSVDEKSIAGANYTGYPGLAFISGQPCYGKPAECQRDAFVGSKTFPSTTYKTGLEYDLTEANLLYFTIATGEKSGGFSALSLPGTANSASSFRPEKLTAYEVGSRNRFLDNRLQVNVEGFAWDYTDAQEFYTTTNAAGAASTALTNAGSATLYGADAEIKFKATPADLLSAGVEFLHSRFDSFTYTSAGALSGLTTGCRVTSTTPYPTLNCAGFSLPRAPNYSGTASYRHIFDLPNGATVETLLSTSYAAARYLTVDYTPASRAGAYIEGDASVTYRQDDWSLTGFIHNLNNAIIYTGAYTLPTVYRGLTMANVAAPRTFGLRLAKSF